MSLFEPQPATLSPDPRKVAIAELRALATYLRQRAAQAVSVPTSVAFQISADRAEERAEALEQGAQLHI
jgi:hypothetical protein